MKKKCTKGDNASLSALILHNQQSRKMQMDAFFGDLAAKYGGQSKTSKTASSKTKTVANKAAKKTSQTTKRTASKSQTKSKAKK